MTVQLGGLLTITLTIGKIGALGKIIMNRKPVSRLAITILVAIATISTISLGVILAVACIIGKMGDASGQVVQESVALVAGLVWFIDLICLVLALGVNSLYDSGSDT